MYRAGVVRGKGKRGHIEPIRFRRPPARFSPGVEFSTPGSSFRGRNLGPSLTRGSAGLHPRIRPHTPHISPRRFG